MAQFDLHRLLSSKRSRSSEDHAACRDVARAWCGLIADAAALHERLAAPLARGPSRRVGEEDRSRS